MQPSRPGRFALGASVAAVVCLGALSRVVATSQGQAPQVTFRAGVDYVRVDVVVTDRKGAPVADLRREDFEVSEQGRVQTIADLQYVSIPAVRADRSDAGDASPAAAIVTNSPPPEARQ